MKSRAPTRNFQAPELAHAMVATARPIVPAMLLPAAAAAAGGGSLVTLDNDKVVMNARILDLGDAVLTALGTQLRSLLGPEARGAIRDGVLRLRTDLTTQVSATVRFSDLGATDGGLLRAPGATNPLHGALSHLFCPPPTNGSGCEQCCEELGGSECDLTVPIDATVTGPAALTLGFDLEYRGAGALFILEDADAFARSLACLLGPHLDGGARVELLRSLEPRTAATVAWEMDDVDDVIP